MRFSEIKQDKGVAGLTILLSLITMLFVIGLLVMIFALMGSELMETAYDTVAVTVTNESGAYLNSSNPYTLATASKTGFANPVITLLINGTGAVIESGNYTISSAGVLTNATAVVWGSPTFLNVSYTYTWTADTSASGVINDTTTGIANVTDWFEIFVVIGAMIVLILLTVIIITAIRGSGLMGSTTQTGSQNVGSA